MKAAWDFEEEREQYDNANDEQNTRIISRAWKREKPFQKTHSEVIRSKSEFLDKRANMDRQETTLIRRAP